MTVTVGRLRDCPVLRTKLVALGHNTIRGAAGAAVLNAELMVAERACIDDRPSQRAAPCIIRDEVRRDVGGGRRAIGAWRQLVRAERDRNERAGRRRVGDGGVTDRLLALAAAAGAGTATVDDAARPRAARRHAEVAAALAPARERERSWPSSTPAFDAAASASLHAL